MRRSQIAHAERPGRTHAGPVLATEDDCLSWGNASASKEPASQPVFFCFFLSRVQARGAHYRDSLSGGREAGTGEGERPSQATAWGGGCARHRRLAFLPLSRRGPPANSPGERPRSPIVCSRQTNGRAPATPRFRRRR